MTLASIGGWTVPVPDWFYYPLVTVVFLVATYFIARLLAGLVADRVRKRRGELAVITRRVVYAAVIAIGVFFALGWAAQNANVTLFGLLLATVVAALGLQGLLQDYVSGYYVLLERHIRPGDRISLEDAGSGTVLEVKLRVTLLQTDSGDLLVVPNSELFGQAVTVHARAVERAAEAKSELPE